MCLPWFDQEASQPVNVPSGNPEVRVGTTLQSFGFLEDGLKLTYREHGTEPRYVLPT